MSLLGQLVRGGVRRARAVLRPPPPRAPVQVEPVVAPAPTAEENPLEVEVPIPGSLLLDIREPGEFAGGVAEGAKLLPMDLVPHHLAELPKDRPITVYCAAGARSFGVATWLRDMGFPDAVSLAGGIGVFPAIDHPVQRPPGVVPGTWVTVPGTATASGVPVGLATRGEVIEQVGASLHVLVRDAQGFCVRVEFPA